jgi:hypothetical protein
MEKIFVHFSGIDEIDIRQTIESCLENALYPERISFGILTQYQQYARETFRDIPNLRIAEISSDEIFGVGITRQMASLLYVDEDYALQIDAHMIFNKNWDEKIIKYYNAAKKVNEKVILSGYAPSWYRSPENEIIKTLPTVIPSLTLVNDKVSAKQPIVGLTDSISPISYDGLIFYEQKAISYHFIFSEIKILENFLPDPFIIYNGDEATLSLRVISRGYRVYMPNEILLWHLDKMNDNFYSTQKRWQPSFLGIQKPKSQREIRIGQTAYQRVKDIFSGNITGYYGAESEEDIIWYSNYIGIDFKESFI